MAEGLNYHESLIQKLGRPHITECPDHYRPNNTLLEQAQNGELILQSVAFEQYFEQRGESDPEYFHQIQKMVERRSSAFPHSRVHGRRLQMIIPAYREGENMDNLLVRLSEQMSVGEENWGVTIVIDHAVPYRNRYETSAKNEMIARIDQFLEVNPQYRGRLDYVFYTRRRDTEHPVLPVGLARKVGEDVLMYEWKAQNKAFNEETQPFYMGLMDMDTGHLSHGLISEMAATVPDHENEDARVIRVKGSFDTRDLLENLDIHILQMMWEGTTSEVGRNSKHNPFNIGRLSAVPARELAMTGGGFAKKLQFPDEDIRHGIQIKWNLPHVKTVEVAGRYSTSARREVNTVEGVKRWLESNGGKFDLATMEIGALIRMYGNWSNHTYRGELGNVDFGGSGGEDDPLQNVEKFENRISPRLIQAMANAFYRFTAYSMYAIDALGDHPKAPEVNKLREQFLRGNAPYFHVQLQALDFIRNVAANDQERFQQLKQVLSTIDAKARSSIANVLDANGIRYNLEQGVLYGINEGLEYGPLYDGREVEGRDAIELTAPFKIMKEQTIYMDYVRKQVRVE